MKDNVLKIILQFTLLVLIQVLVLNRVSVLGYGVPLLYVYLIVKLPLHFNRSLVLLLGFLLGFAVDALTHSAGINAAATVFAAFVRPYIQNVFFSQEDFGEFPPSIANLGAAKFYKYTVCLVVLHHLTIFVIEYMSFSETMSLALHAFVSSVLTLLIITGLESFSYKQPSKNERR